MRLSPAAAGLVVVVDFLLFYILTHIQAHKRTQQQTRVQDAKFWRHAHNVNKDMRNAPRWLSPLPQQEKCIAGNAIAN